MPLLSLYDHVGSNSSDVFLHQNFVRVKMTDRGNLTNNKHFGLTLQNIQALMKIKNLQLLFRIKFTHCSYCPFTKLRNFVSQRDTIYWNLSVSVESIPKTSFLIFPPFVKSIVCCVSLSLF